MQREQRRLRATEIRAVTDDNGSHTLELRVITPGVVDDYGSLWNPHAFDEHAGTRLPVLCWSHDWTEPLGPGLEYRASDDGPVVRFALSDFDAVPMARRAYTQVADGTITDCSVGFSGTQRRDPTSDEQRDFPGIREVIEQAELDEVSLVLRGAVPGAKVLALRSASGVRQVDEAFVIELGRKVAAGELTQAEAQATLTLAAGELPPAKEPPKVIPDPGLTAESDAALDALGMGG